MRFKPLSGEACVRLFLVVVIATLFLMVVGMTEFSEYQKYKSNQQVHSKLQIHDPIFDLFNKS